LEIILEAPELPWLSLILHGYLSTEETLEFEFRPPPNCKAFFFLIEAIVRAGPYSVVREAVPTGSTLGLSTLIKWLFLRALELPVLSLFLVWLTRARVLGVALIRLRKMAPPELHRYVIPSIDCWF